MRNVRGDAYLAAGPPQQHRFCRWGSTIPQLKLIKTALALFVEQAVTLVVAESLPHSAVTSTINHLPTLGGAAVTAIPTVSTTHYRTILPNTRPIAAASVSDSAPRPALCCGVVTWCSAGTATACPQPDTPNNTWHTNGDPPQTAHCRRVCWHVTQQRRACLAVCNDQRCVVVW